MNAEREMVGRVVDVGGRGVRTATWSGDGRGEVPLLVCNGIGANLEVLDPFARALSEREVIAFDVPGTKVSHTIKQQGEVIHKNKAIYS